MVLTTSSEEDKRAEVEYEEFSGGEIVSEKTKQKKNAYRKKVVYNQREWIFFYGSDMSTASILSVDKRRRIPS